MRHRHAALQPRVHRATATLSGYYSYMWSEVLDADAFAAFEETGNVFSQKIARKLRDNIYAAGNRRDPEQAYLAFRGRPPEVEGLLRKRGFA